MDEQPTYPAPNQTPTAAPNVPPNQPQSKPGPYGPKQPNIKPLIFIIIAVVIAVVAVAVVAFLLMQGIRSNKNNSNANKGGENKVITVNGNRYVNACRLMSVEEVTTKFGAVAPNAQVSNVYAEEGLPTDKIPRNRGVESSCTYALASDTIYSFGGLTISVAQRASEKEAKEAFEKLYDNEQETQRREQSSQQLGRSIYTDNTTLLDGAENTVFNPTSMLSTTLDGNKLISFKASSTFTPEQQEHFKKSIIAALPTVVKKANDSNLTQAKLTPSTEKDGKQVQLFGSKNGDVTYANPCDIFTSADFKALSGRDADPSEVELRYSLEPASVATTNSRLAFSGNSCERSTVTYTPGGRIDVRIEYNKSSEQANASIKQTVEKLSSSSYSDMKYREVSGIGDYAVLAESSAEDGLGSSKGTTYLYAQKGPYRVDIRAGKFNPDKKPISLETYQKQAPKMLERLK